MLNQAEADGRLQGVKVCQGAPSVSHLLFADDSLILCRANGSDALQLQSILDMYEEGSDQKINRDKSAVLFSPNTSTECREEVMQALNIQRETMNEKYLGLPVFVGHNRKKVFSYLKGRKEKMLSRAGKEILIKVVAQAIPTFAMGCFDITKELCDEFHDMPLLVELSG